MANPPRLIYFHGIPGSADELALFKSKTANQTKRFDRLDRNFTDQAVTKSEHFRALARRINEKFPHEPLKFVGFSLGASAALRVAPLLGDQVAEIDLISAAAPLDLGNYLDDMAGATLFRLARTSSIPFHLSAKIQSLIARKAPGFLISMLFHSAQSGDRALLNNPTFNAEMSQILRQCLGEGLPTYIREIELFTQDWADELDAIHQPVRLFHGVQDNWSPPAMARDLAARLSDCEEVIFFDGLSHYSALKEYLLRF